MVPPSPRAPHQIALSGKFEGRFYTRDATGNRILGQTEIEQLYRRRDRWEQDSEGMVRDTFRREIGTPERGRVCLVLTANLLRPIRILYGVLRPSTRPASYSALWSRQSRSDLGDMTSRASQGC
jgi:hypothetical protein